MRTTPEHIAEATRLHDNGWTWRAIGERLGFNERTIRGWIHGRIPEMYDKCLGCGLALPDDDDAPTGGRQSRWCSEGCRKRHSYSGTCEVCGERTGYSGEGTKPSRYCLRHTPAVQRAKDKARDRTLKMIELRKRGLLNYEIEERIGLSPNTVAVAFNRADRYGLEVPPPPYWNRKAA